AVFLGVTYLFLNTNRHARKKTTVTVSVCLAALLVVNAVSANYFGRIDFTAENRFTLSPLTKSTVSDLPDNVHITLLLDGQLPSGFERLKRSTVDLLSDLAAYSSGKITFDVVNPMDADAQQQQDNIAALA